MTKENEHEWYDLGTENVRYIMEDCSIILKCRKCLTQFRYFPSFYDETYLSKCKGEVK